MVPAPLARGFPLLAVVSRTVKVRFDEFGLPPETCTVIVWVVTPGANVRVPEAGT